MRLSYDAEVDVATVYLLDEIGPGGAPNSAICDLEADGGSVILLLSGEGKLVGIEVLGATKLLPPALLGPAEA
jgi:uncharacterized protein YuzE